MSIRIAILPLLFIATTVTAFGQQDSVEPSAEKITAGPADAREKVKPGPIDKDAAREFKQTESGLRYRILRKSDKVKPRRRDAVEVHYKGWLGNGEIFDSSYQRGKKAKFTLQQVIKGWTEGLQLVGVDGMIELEIPPELGYGRRGAPPTIPPNATLHFVVELYRVTKLEP